MDKHLQNPGCFFILDFFFTLELSDSPHSFSSALGYSLASFSMSLQLLTPSELGDRSIFVSRGQGQKWGAKGIPVQVSDGVIKGNLSKTMKNHARPN